MLLETDRKRREKHDVLWLGSPKLCLCVCMHMCLPFCACVWYPCGREPCQNAVNKPLVCSMLDTTDMDFSQLWASHWMLFSTVFPLFKRSRHGQSALHPATWLELHIFYEWHHQASTPKMTLCVCVCVLATECESVCVCLWVCGISLLYHHCFCSVISLSTLIWTPRIDSVWLFAPHLCQLCWICIRPSLIKEDLGFPSRKSISLEPSALVLLQGPRSWLTCPTWRVTHASTRGIPA